MGARRARRGHVYRRRTKGGGWSAWHAVIDLDRGPDGQRRQTTKSFGTRAEAYAWLAEMNQQQAADGPTLAQWLTEWQERLGHLRESTAVSYRGHIGNFLIPLLGDIPLSEVGAGEVEALHEMLAAAGISTALARRVHATLSTALADAERDGLITNNPCGKVRLPRGDRYEPAVWSSPQAAHFLDVTAGDELAGLWRLALLLGMRRGELLGLRWRDLDLDAGTLTVRSTRTLVGDQVVEGPPKSARSRRVLPLDPRTVEVLGRHWKQQTHKALEGVWGPVEYVFTDQTGQPLHPAWVSRRFAEIVDRLGLPTIRFHDLRHTSASLGLAAGESLKAVSARLGHSSIVVTADTYLTPPDSLARAATCWLAGELDHTPLPRERGAA